MESSDRSIHVNNFFPVLSTPLKICVLTVHALVMIYTKFHCIRTKTFCLSAIGINSAPPHFLGSVTSWKLSRESPEKKLWKGLQKGSGGALEGWGPFGYNQEAAQDVRVYPEEDSGLCQEEPHLAGLEDAGGGVPAEPGAAHASNAPGGDCQGWWHDQILN